MTINVPIKRLHGDAKIPSQAKDSDAGYDLHAIERYDLEPGEREMFRTGIAVAIPRGYVGYIKPRSGLAARNGLDVLGGVIDSGYRGEIGVILLNTDVSETIHVGKGDRIAQLVIQPVADVAFDERYDLEDSERGDGGFGSSGA
jgi:dUTP pyrophosphatase